jgi:hypothetical protein
MNKTAGKLDFNLMNSLNNKLFPLQSFVPANV